MKITAADILDFHQTRPFEPFEIRVAYGRVYTVDHPEFFSMARAGNVVYYSTDDSRLVAISVGQITSLEKVNAPSRA
jgi:hypothetical protein